MALDTLSLTWRKQRIYAGAFLKREDFASAEGQFASALCNPRCHPLIGATIEGSRRKHIGAFIRSSPGMTNNDFGCRLEVTADRVGSSLITDLSLSSEYHDSCYILAFILERLDTSSILLPGSCPFRN